MSIAAGSVAALTLAGTAAAAPRQAPASIRAAAHGHIGGTFLSAAVAYLQIDKATLVTDLKSGQSLAQVATAQGKTADGLVTALLAPAKLKLDAAVLSGKLTADREAARLTKLQTLLATVVNRTVTPHTATGKHPVRVGPRVILQAATSYLGVDLKTILQDVRNGQTLADIATAKGLTSTGLVSAVVAAVKAKLDTQVTAGKITSAQETTFLAQLQTNATAFVNGSH